MATTLSAPEHDSHAVADGVGHVTIDRAERFNSLDVRTAQDLRRAGLALARDDEVACRRAAGATASSAAAPISSTSATAATPKISAI